jgi:hypothetical protein
MRYRVTFQERFDGAGNNTENPPEFINVEEGVVLDATYIQRDAPPSLHVQEVMDEDDSFLSRGTEVWEYEIAAGRDRDFIDALKNSEMVLEYIELDTVPGLGGDSVST